MVRSFAGYLVVWLLGPALALGQAAAPSTTFTVISRIVSVDVVVRDSYGRIVRGLPEKDFRVLEDGKEQKIDYFRDHTRDVMTEPAKDIHPREDDRNEELEESPVPDPTAKDTDGEDDPEAD